MVPEQILFQLWLTHQLFSWIHCFFFRPPTKTMNRGFTVLHLSPVITQAFSPQYWWSQRPFSIWNYNNKDYLSIASWNLSLTAEINHSAKCLWSFCDITRQVQWNLDFTLFKGPPKTNVNRRKCKIREIRMLQYKENCGLLCIIILENHLKYIRLNTNNVNENMVLGLFCNALSTAVYVTSVRWDGDNNWWLERMWKEVVMAYFKALSQHLLGMTSKYFFNQSVFYFFSPW
jgi:hypothetical protein